MSNHHNQHQQQDSQNHDDCEDCKRQRAQNEKFIAVYERLQQVDKRTQQVKGSIHLHQRQVQKNKEVINAIDQKVEQAKLDKKEQDMSHFQQFGYHLYADTITNLKKSETQKQNERLKNVLKKIYQENKQKNNLPPIVLQKYQHPLELPPILPPILFKESTQWFQKPNQSPRTQSRTDKSFQQTSMEKSFEIFSTKSSFNMTKRKTFEKKDFEQLNLWLFEHKNQILEKQLYEDKACIQTTVTNNNGSVNKNVENYMKNVKNATILRNSTVLRSSMRRQSDLLKKRMTDSMNQSYLGQKSDKNRRKINQYKIVEPQNLSQSVRVPNKRAYKGRVLPVICSK